MSEAMPSNNEKKSALKGKNIDILEALNEYRFLTVQQMVRLGIADTNTTMYRYMKNFNSGKAKHIGTVHYKDLPEHGRLPSMHFLKKAGAEVLQEQLNLLPEQIGFKDYDLHFERDRAHRIQLVDFHIALKQFCTIYNGDIEFFHVYYDFSGANRTKDETREALRSDTKIDYKDTYIRPDFNCCIYDHTGKRSLFTGEIQRGKDTKRNVEKIKAHAYAMAEGALSQAYGEDTFYKVLYIFNDKDAMRLTLDRVNKDPNLVELLEQLKRYFVFTTGDDVIFDIQNHWKQLDGSSVELWDILEVREADRPIPDVYDIGQRIDRRIKLFGA